MTLDRGVDRGLGSTMTNVWSHLRVLLITNGRGRSIPQVDLRSAAQECEALADQFEEPDLIRAGHPRPEGPCRTVPQPARDRQVVSG